MKTKLLIRALFVPFLIVISDIHAQKFADFPSKPFKQVTFEIFGLTYPDNDYFDPLTGQNKTFWENTINGSVFTNLNKHLLLGFSYSHIWTRFNSKSAGQYYIAGIITRYSIVPSKEKANIYIDAGYHLGNFCDCLNDIRNRNEIPFRKEDMRLLSIGFGGTIHLHKALWFKGGFLTFLWLNRDKNIYFGGYNIPTIGLQLNFR
jgi:hypothetical protein